MSLSCGNLILSQDPRPETFLIAHPLIFDSPLPTEFVFDIDLVLQQNSFEPLTKFFDLFLARSEDHATLLTGKDDGWQKSHVIYMARD